MDKKIDIVILAGGKGSRIKNLTNGTPKPLVNFKKIPFLQFLINYYSKFNFRNIFILAGYKGRLLKKKYHNQKQNFTNIKCFIEKTKLDTGGALHLIKNKVSSNFFLVNGDTYLLPDINAIIKKINLKNKFGLMTVINSNSKNVKLNNLRLIKNQISFGKKNNIINAGFYFLNKNIFKYINKKTISLENEVFPKLINKNKIIGMKYIKYFIDIGTRSNFFKAKKELPKLLRRPAAFFDRDGVINYDYGYVSNIKKFKFRNGVIKALKYLNKKKYFIFIITNQGGIAKKKLSIKKFHTLHEIIKKKLTKKNVFIDDLEYCPHHPDGTNSKFKKKCDCRKPGIGMIKKINSKWLIDLKKSFFIGDKITDKKCAKRANLKFFYAEKNLFTKVRKIC
jgi:D-glycero-D-manno-heptose 1,7-bisphosphate phosphatase